MMDEVPFPLLAAAGGTSLAMRLGNGANQVLSGDAAGPGNVLTGLLVPKDTDGISSEGASLFGTDYLYQRIRNELCALSGGYWSYGSYAGVCALYLNYARAYASYSTGFRCACYTG
jgi:hypothetical protein